MVINAHLCCLQMFGLVRIPETKGQQNQPVNIKNWEEEKFEEDLSITVSPWTCSSLEDKYSLSLSRNSFPDMLSIAMSISSLSLPRSCKHKHNNITQDRNLKVALNGKKILLEQPRRFPKTAGEYLIANPTTGDAKLRVEVAEPESTEKPIENLPLLLSEINLLLQLDWDLWLLLIIFSSNSRRRHRRLQSREPVTAQARRNTTKRNGWETVRFTVARRRNQENGSGQGYNSVDWKRQSHGFF